MISRDRKPSGYFSPSYLGKQARLVYLGYLGLFGKPSPESILKMENGKYFHYRLGNWFERMGILMEKEFKIDLGLLKIRGKGDFIIVRPVDKTIHIVEAKSMASWLFTALKQPNLEDLIQWNLYSYAKGIERGLIYYENKDNQKPKIFEVWQNKELIDQTIDKINYVLECIHSNKLPRKCLLCKTSNCDSHSVCEELEKSKEVSE